MSTFLNVPMLVCIPSLLVASRLQYTPVFHTPRRLLAVPRPRPRTQVVCTAEQGQGLEILGAFVLRAGALYLDVDVSFWVFAHDAHNGLIVRVRNAFANPYALCARSVRFARARSAVVLVGRQVGGGSGELVRTVVLTPLRSLRAGSGNPGRNRCSCATLEKRFSPVVAGCFTWSGNERIEGYFSARLKAGVSYVGTTIV